MNGDGSMGEDPTDDYSPPGDDTPPPSGDSDMVRLVNNGTFGSILTDADGRTLYFSLWTAKESPIVQRVA